MTELRQRQPRIECPGFLAFVRTRPCCTCGVTGRTQAAHIRFGSAIYGKRGTGAAEKPSDKWAVPLCGPLLGQSPGCHAMQHSMNELAFWRIYGIDPLWVASRLWDRFAMEHPRMAARALNDTPVSKRKRIPKQAWWPPGEAPKAQKSRKLQSRGFSKAKRGFRT